MIVRLLALLLLAGPALAQDLPAQFSITGVAADDTLNIRAEPSGSAPKLGEYGPYALNIEVLETTPDGSWGRVGIPESNGWVSMRFLERQDAPPFEIPRPMTCYGTEPFWTLAMTVRGDEFSALGEDLRFLTMTRQIVAREGYFASFVEGPTLERFLTIRRAACNDGMSDRDFGFSALLMTEAPDGNTLLSGCCTLDGNN
jgi:uncharacterized membrane protein